MKSLLKCVLAAAILVLCQTASNHSNVTPSPLRDVTSHNNKSAFSYYNYPWQQYALPECATQQVCNAVYTRLERINTLCACPERSASCSVSFSSDDAHTIELVTDTSGKALTLIKTCEPIGNVRSCRGGRDWSLLALQNVRTGRSHYLVVCRCVQHEGLLEGPIAHENPPYAKIPGIRVFGMVCVRGAANSALWRKKVGNKHRVARKKRALPWHFIRRLVAGIDWS